MALILIATILFGVTHSILANPTIKQRIQHRMRHQAYHGLYRIIYNGIASIQLGVILLWVWQDQSSVWVVPDSLRIVFLIVQIGSIIGIVISLLQIDLGHFTGITQLMEWIQNKEELAQEQETLQTGGLYRFMRHPLYLFSIIFLWAFPMMSARYVVFAIVVTAYFLIGSRIEEKQMLIRFGDAYRDYQESTSWMLPLPRRPRS